MPNDRIRACIHCHHLLLRRDAFCDVCGHAIPLRTRRRWRSVLARMGLMVTGAMAVYLNAIGGP